jgi:hypothetical protein
VQHSIACGGSWHVVVALRQEVHLAPGPQLIVVSVYAKQKHVVTLQYKERDKGPQLCHAHKKSGSGSQLLVSMPLQLFGFDIQGKNQTPNLSKTKIKFKKKPDYPE